MLKWTQPGALAMMCFLQYTLVIKTMIFVGLQYLVLKWEARFCAGSSLASCNSLEDLIESWTAVLLDSILCTDRSPCLDSTFSPPSPRSPDFSGPWPVEGRKGIREQAACLRQTRESAGASQPDDWRETILHKSEIATWRIKIYIKRF